MSYEQAVIDLFDLILQDHVFTDFETEWLKILRKNGLLIF